MSSIKHIIQSLCKRCCILFFFAHLWYDKSLRNRYSVKFAEWAMRWPNATKSCTWTFLKIECNFLLESSGCEYMYGLAGRIMLQIKRCHSSYLQLRNYEHHHTKYQTNHTQRIVTIKRPPPVYDVYINSVGFQNQSNFGTLDGRIDANHEYIASQHLNA